MVSEKITKIISIVSTLMLLSGFFFMAGLYIAHKKIEPYPLVLEVYSLFLSLSRYGEIVPANRLVYVGNKFPRERFTFYQGEFLLDGYYLFLGYDGEGRSYAAWLYDNNGKKWHTWNIEYEKLDPDGPLNGADFPHAFKVMKDGSILISFDAGDVMARIDTCSNPVWVKKGVYHHSLEEADDGSYWTWRGDGSAYGQYQYLENFNPENGKTIRSIGLVEDVVKKSADQARLFSLRLDYEFVELEKDPVNNDEIDIFHPNDIDVLSSSLAYKFPMFEAGDLLISLRSTHLVAVLDPHDYSIKWWSRGPWRYQHDPDFTTEGMISVYDNNSHLRQSEIVKIDPKTNDVANDLLSGNLKFYSAAQGKHQYLPNGNLLVVVPGEGRIIEVTAAGNKIFEFNNISPISGEFNEHVANGMWVSEDYFDEFPKCDK